MENTIKIWNSGEGKILNSEKFSKIPIKLYSDRMRKHQLFIKKSFKKNHSPPPESVSVKVVEHNTNTSLEGIKIENTINRNNQIEDLQKSKQLFPSFRENLFEYWVEYSNNSSIQGVKYVGEMARPVFERLAWVVFFCISLYFCINLICQTYTKWETTPVLLSFARSPTPTWKIPFPAITICPQTKAKRSIYNFTEGYLKMVTNSVTPEEVNTFSDMALVCDRHIYNGGKLTTGYDTVDFLLKVAPQLDDVLWHCEYIGFKVEVTCHDLFTPILTEEGLCFTFNMIEKSKMYRDVVFRNIKSTESKFNGWTLETGYSKNSPVITYPRRAVSARFQPRIVVELKAFVQELDYVCKGSTQGFKIVIHNPAETPKVGVHFFRAPFSQEVTVAVRPEMVITADSLKNYNPHKRQCYFSEERYLAFFRSYTQQSCELECLTNFTRAKCGCVSHYMPYEDGTYICGSGSIQCMTDAREELALKEVQMGIGKEASDNNRLTECDCLPGCTSLVYHSETSQADINLEKFLNNYRENTNTLYKDVRVTRINIFVKESQFITVERNEIYGFTDFLANCGGLLGLFTGFSFLSLVEIIYFLSLRLLCNIKRYGTHYWSGSQKLLNDIKENEN